MEPFRRPTKGIGLGLRLDASMKVTEVVLHGPCAGKVCVGDIITHIDDFCVRDKKLQDIIKYTTGEEGSKVKVCLTRGIFENTHTFEVVRCSFKASKPDLIKRQVELGFKKRDENYVTTIFNQFCIDDSQSERNIPKERILEALKVFDVATDITENDLAKTEFLFESLDRNGDKILDLREFIKAVQAPTMLELLTRDLPLHSLLSDTIPHYAGDEPLLTVSELTAEDIDFIAEQFKEGLKKILQIFVETVGEKVKKLGKQKWNPAASKFESDLPRMKCGSIDDFHKGVVGRVGVSSLDFEREMELEHCSKGGHVYQFTTSNYRITTCAKKEWEFVFPGQERIAPPAEQMQGDPMGGDRQIPDVDKLMQLDQTKQAKLIRPEVLSLVLYSGPMFYVYNAVLRQSPEELHKVFKEADNLFPCTIFVLTSALQKLSRVTRMEPGMKLYRGLKADVNLPELFFKCDRQGCTGFTEWGFISATAKVEVALAYTGCLSESSKDLSGQDIKGTPRLLQIQVGSVDRGADIKLYSQYPGEEEFMFVPCSFIEKSGDISAEFHDKGVVELVPVKINSNLKTKTVEELLQQKKDMHIAAFAYQIAQVQFELQKTAEEKGKVRLDEDKSADGKLTVEAFVKRILDQCKDVLSRHQARPTADYVNDRVFRTLVLEMVDTTVNARTKLEEWLENPTSFIRFRWNSALISVRRRWLSYLENKRLVARNSGGDVVEASRLVRQAMGLIKDSVHETNELDETKIMSCAAEGRSSKILQLLVEAGAQVNQQRLRDGVTALWLAAENGHDNCIKALLRLSAQVDQAAHDGTTPLCIAARNGKHACVEMLMRSGADVRTTGDGGKQPVHEAAMYGHEQTVQALVKQNADINAQNWSLLTPYHIAKAAGHEDLARMIVHKLDGKATEAPQHANLFVGKRRRLIVSTGDISDIDGFLALAEYAKLESDVIFVMNYPAYIGVSEDDADPTFAEENPGLGYKYSAKEVMDRVKPGSSIRYDEIVDRYPEAENHNEKMKCAMTDMAFAIAQKVWSDVRNHGTLFFYIGGINAINPFSSAAIKNEVFAYANHVDLISKLETKQGVIYGPTGAPAQVRWEQYSDIYMDFNGSLAFWSGHLSSKLSEVELVKKIKGVFVMGGVLADQEPVTLPSIPNVLNRFSSATMNQLYHPQNAANFFAFLAQFNIPTFTVTNNIVADLSTFEDADKKNKTFEGVEKFLKNNGIHHPFISELAKVHYSLPHNPPRKPFDFYTARALGRLLPKLEKGTQFRSATGGQGQVTDQKYLFISNVYGITFVSPHKTWEETRACYVAVLDTEMQETDSAFIKNKKEYFKREIVSMESIQYLASMPVTDLNFNLDDSSKRLELCSQ